MTETRGQNRKDPPVVPGLRLFRADWVLTGVSAPLAEGAVLAEGPNVLEVGPFSALAGAGAEEVLDLQGHLLMPGLVNAHTHRSSLS